MIREVSHLITDIQSPHNRHYKRWRKDVANPERAECPYIPIEGIRQIRELARSEPLDLLLYCPSRISLPSQVQDRARRIVALEEKLFERLTELESSPGVIGFFTKPSWSWSDIGPYILYLDRLQDPGNLGTLLRTAAATGEFSIVTSPNSVSCFNSKVIRASAGYLFSVPFLEEISLQEIVERKYQLLAGSPVGTTSLFEADFGEPLAIIVGNEGQGVELSCVQTSIPEVRIPMSEKVDSLNAAVSGSLLMYEVLRRKYP